ncbi:MAG: hypothetical protein KAX47_05765, partial [Zoogloea sp.]|nr:hypothetical protein [Zoogloea sp.]
VVELLSTKLELSTWIRFGAALAARSNIDTGRTNLVAPSALVRDLPISSDVPERLTKSEKEFVAEYSNAVKRLLEQNWRSVR